MSRRGTAANIRGVGEAGHCLASIRGSTLSGEHLGLFLAGTGRLEKKRRIFLFFWCGLWIWDRTNAGEFLEKRQKNQRVWDWGRKRAAPESKWLGLGSWKLAGVRGVAKDTAAGSKGLVWPAKTRRVWEDRRKRHLLDVSSWVWPTICRWDRIL